MLQGMTSKYFDNRAARSPDARGAVIVRAPHIRARGYLWISVQPHGPFTPRFLRPSPARRALDGESRPFLSPLRRLNTSRSRPQQSLSCIPTISTFPVL